MRSTPDLKKRRNLGSGVISEVNRRGTEEDFGHGVANVGVRRPRSSKCMPKAANASYRSGEGTKGWICQTIPTDIKFMG